MKKGHQSSHLPTEEIKYYTLPPKTELHLSSGKTLQDVTLAYETYGSLNGSKSNAILLLHALSGSTHAAANPAYKNSPPGWWDNAVGPGKAFDTNKYFIICSNVLGGCNGSTGPASIDSTTGKPYGLDFPVITIHDMVNAQHHLINHLGINTLLAVAGGSMGGMQALEWSLQYPEKVHAVICIAASHSQSAQGIAFNEVGRQAIFQDPNWNNGDYYNSKAPQRGLALARMIGHITYLSEKKMHEKFGRQLQDNELFSFNFNSEFQVESYLHHQGYKFINRFDANAYLYLSKALDYFDVKSDYGEGGLFSAFERVTSDFLMISFSSDWLYTPAQMREVVNALRANSKNVVYIEIETDNGHDAFLLPNETQHNTIANFLRREYSKLHKKLA